ncbi:DUF6292 family protein [Actinokineospora iranica]|uniref:DUF6292 domain-containing protein n=1 Tax=Actinokineospora iranica TaxID=1271860 RepID=A0A1G6NHS5_9PSEU|nr:DUF6292 family protein [Actinokineospora iranica]SDC66827.1 hypothetical protein SAMN05216174_103350 [Actinokineospora iranica]
MNSGSDSTHALRRGLEGYLRAVAVALRLPGEGVSCEISDTATAYVALPGHGGDDLMLIWDERTGWTLAVEHAPSAEPEILGRFGPDQVPPPDAVAEFVARTRAGRSPEENRPVVKSAGDRWALAKRLSRYA